METETENLLNDQADIDTAVENMVSSINKSIEEYADHTEIPTLREVLRLIRPWKVKANIELKTGIFWYPTK